MYKKIAVIVLCTLASACHVGYSLSGASIPEYAKTFSVQYFKNQAQLAGPTISQTFTDALRNYIASHSSLSLTDAGDLDFTGVISGYTIAPVTVSSTSSASAPAQSATTRLSITIDVTYTDKKDPKKCFNASFTRYADFPSSQNISAVQDGLITQIDNQLVQDVFDKAFNNW